ncbi:MAG: glucose-1-phosphate thymidylyltransferase RfbA [Eubacteriales bacterium]
MKGIILAAGKGTRLYPMTLPVSKPLLPVYDKPLIYYAVSTLIQGGIKDILIIIPPKEEESFRYLLGDGSALGISISYAQQIVPRGIADAFIVGADFIGTDDVCLILGDNIFHTPDFSKRLKEVAKRKSGATVFGYYVSDPRPFGVVEFDQEGKAISIEEKPDEPKSNYVIPGLYFYDNQVIKMAQNLSPSERGELEITDINKAYLEKNQLHVEPLEKDFLWLDAGTADSLLHASIAIHSEQKAAGQLIGCIEEEAYLQGHISLTQLHQLGEALAMTTYGQYLLDK